MVRVGVRSLESCGMVGTAAGSLPMKRKVFPSTRSRPDKGCAAPVQCVVPESVRLSVADQTLKYGSWTMSGVDGGRSCAVARGVAARLRKSEAMMSVERFIGKFLLRQKLRRLYTEVRLLRGRGCKKDLFQLESRIRGRTNTVRRV